MQKKWTGFFVAVFAIHSMKGMLAVSFKKPVEQSSNSAYTIKRKLFSKALGYTKQGDIESAYHAYLDYLGCIDKKRKRKRMRIFNTVLQFALKKCPDVLLPKDQKALSFIEQIAGDIGKDPCKDSALIKTLQLVAQVEQVTFGRQIDSIERRYRAAICLMEKGLVKGLRVLLETGLFRERAIRVACGPLLACALVKSCARTRKNKLPLDELAPAAAQRYNMAKLLGEQGVDMTAAQWSPITYACNFAQCGCSYIRQWQ